MNAVSVKRLRTELPAILQRVEKGESFILIYHSRAIGELTPMPKTTAQAGGPSLYDLLAKPFGEIRLPRGATSVDIIRDDRR